MFFDVIIFVALTTPEALLQGAKLFLLSFIIPSMRLAPQFYLANSIYKQSCSYLKEIF